LNRSAPAVPVRIRILAVLFLLTFVNYLLRTTCRWRSKHPGGISLLTQDAGWILAASICLRHSSGAWRLFWRLARPPAAALAIIAGFLGLLTLLTGFRPHVMVASAGGAMLALTTTQVSAGVTNAPLFPVMAGAIANWFPGAALGLPGMRFRSAGLGTRQAAIGPGGAAGS